MGGWSSGYRVECRLPFLTDFHLIEQEKRTFSTETGIFFTNLKKKIPVSVGVSIRSSCPMNPDGYRNSLAKLAKKIPVSVESVRFSCSMSVSYHFWQSFTIPRFVLLWFPTLFRTFFMIILYIFWLHLLKKFWFVQSLRSTKRRYLIYGRYQLTQRKIDINSLSRIFGICPTSSHPLALSSALLPGRPSCICGLENYSTRLIFFFFTGIRVSQ